MCRLFIILCETSGSSQLLLCPQYHYVLFRVSVTLELVLDIYPGTMYNNTYFSPGHWSQSLIIPGIMTEVSVLGQLHNHQNASPAPVCMSNQPRPSNYIQPYPQNLKSGPDSEFCPGHVSGYKTLRMSSIESNFSPWDLLSPWCHK